MADRLKLAAGLRNLPETAREDLAGREQDIQRGKTVELLRRAGKEMYENPIVNTAIGFTPVLGDIQAGVEAYRSAEAGDWGNAGLNAVGMLPFIPMLGKTVWHGSPHTFDKFDLSKIGTGEGAQAYGHGLYLAESPGVATGYKEALSRYKDLPESGPVSAAGAMLDSGVPMERIKETMNKVYGSEGFFAKKFGDKNVDIEDAIQKAQAAIAKGKEGYLYKVDLPDEQIAKMLDWDKPLSEQPKSVQEALSVIDPDMYHHSGNDYDPMELGQSIYQRLANQKRDYAITAGLNDQTTLGGMQYAASKELNELGIPGIQYLDQASRGAGEGTRNYVVFSDEIPQILERNNQPVAQALREYKQLESLNPTGTVMTEYNPLERASLPLGKNLTTLDVTSGVSPDEMVEIYRGVPQGVSEISPGDFITTNRQLAQDYAGGGNVISQKVPYRTILDDLTEPLGEEYIYRP